MTSEQFCDQVFEGSNLNDNLIFYHNFDGDGIDQSSNGLDAVVIEADKVRDRFLQDNEALLFNKNTNIYIPSNDKLKVNYPFSFSLWAIFESEDQFDNALFSNNFTQDNYHGIGGFRNVNGDVSLFVGNGLGNTSSNNRKNIVSKNAEIEPDKWTHIVFVMNGPADGSAGNINIMEAEGSFSVIAGQNVCPSDTHYFEVVYVSEDFEVDLGDDIISCGAPIFLSNNAGTAVLDWSTGESSTQIEVNESGTYIASIDANCFEGADTVLVTIVDDLQFDISETYNLCQGQFADVTLPAEYDSIIWFDGQNNTSQTFSQAGIYSAIAYQKFCLSDTFNFEVILTDTLSDISILQEYYFCDPLDLLLEIPPQNGNILWSNGTQSETVEIDNAGEYSLLVSNVCDQDEYYFQVRHIKNNLDYFQDHLICEGDILTISVPDSIVSFAWNTGEISRHLSVSQAGNYYLIYNKEGCEFESNVINVETERCIKCKFYIPNIFSPNSKTGNQLFEIESNYIECLQGLTITVFDRWGSLVHSDLVSVPWDGRWSNNKIVEGVYVYNLKGVADAETINLVGSVTIID